MLKLADNLEKNCDEFARLESTDNGKPLMMATKDVKFSASVLRYYAGWTSKIHG